MDARHHSDEHVIPRQRELFRAQDETYQENLPSRQNSPTLPHSPVGATSSVDATQSNTNSQAPPASTPTRHPPALSVANVDAHNRAYENNSPICRAEVDQRNTNDHRQRIRVAGQWFDVQLRDDCIPGLHQGKTPLETWLDCKADAFIATGRRCKSESDKPE